MGVMVSDITWTTGDNIEGDLDSILLNPIASTIPKWRTFKLLRLGETFQQIGGLG
jgi:hypothetical protein